MGISINEDSAHFSMLCMLAAPLISWNELRNMSNKTIDILRNRDIIVSDQDSLVIMALKTFLKEKLEVWFNPLKNGN